MKRELVYTDFLLDFEEKNFDRCDYDEFVEDTGFDGDFRDWAYREFLDNAETDIYFIKKGLKGRRFKMTGKLGLWDGGHDVDTKDNAYDIDYFIDELFGDYNRIWLNEDNTLTIETYHHDGKNYFTLIETTGYDLSRVLQEVC